MSPYFIGCPSWNEQAWRGTVYPSDSRPADALGHYVQLFNAVEGNTTFYAAPNEQTVARWAELMPESFHFCAKLPGTISHAGDLREQVDASQQFRALLAPLGARVTPFWLQLPATFTPVRLAELAYFIEQWGDWPLAVEVRHPAFFDKGDEERALNRLLHECGVERICLDSRALFSCPADNAAIIHAQSKKPRLPTRPRAFSECPQVRFIGHPQLAANDPFMQPWLDKVAGWIEQGLHPHVFLHTPDNHLAPQLAWRFHQQLTERLPGLPALPEPRLQASSQLGLL